MALSIQPGQLHNYRDTTIDAIALWLNPDYFSTSFCSRRCPLCLDTKGAEKSRLRRKRLTRLRTPLKSSKLALQRSSSDDFERFVLRHVQDSVFFEAKDTAISTSEGPSMASGNCGLCSSLTLRIDKG